MDTQISVVRVGNNKGKETSVGGPSWGGQQGEVGMISKGVEGAKHEVSVGEGAVLPEY